MGRTLRNLMLVLCLPVGMACAEQNSGVDSEVDAATTQKIVEKLRASIDPALPIRAIFQTPVAGLLGVEVSASQTLYVSRDGSHLVAGDMYQLGRVNLNLAEVRRAVLRKELMDQVPIEQMVVFSPQGKAKTYINVFTDVDCGYCRKLHQEVAEINALGIEVRYLAYPRAGLNTPTYDKIVSAWCATDRENALTSLKAGKTIPNRTCENPVAKQFELGQSVGVNGTPAIVTEDGMLLPGYMPARELAAAVGIQ